jgi:4-hydroxy-3-polyprenylbenzoate decarboxylase
MKTVTEAGGIICPASPSFYSKPETFEDLALTVVDRARHWQRISDRRFRWGENVIFS